MKINQVEVFINEVGEITLVQDELVINLSHHQCELVADEIKKLAFEVREICNGVIT